MAKPKTKLTKKQVNSVVTRRERGVKREQIAEETGLHRNVVGAILAAKGLSKTSAEKRRKYRKWLADMLGEAQAVA